VNSKGDIVFEPAEVEQAERGKVTLAEESITNLTDVKSILFPGGTPDSFDRGAATLSKLPGPKFLGGGGPAPFSFKGQEVFRKLGNSLAAKRLIQTGVASNPEEREEMARAFLAGFSSDPHSMFNAINELDVFYQRFLQQTDPTGSIGLGALPNPDRVTPDTGSQFSEGQVVDLNGKKWRVVDATDPSDPVLEEI